MSKAWIENISDKSIVDRHLTYCFDLNHNTEKDAPMTELSPPERRREQMGEYLAGNEVVAVQLATEFEVVK